MVLVLMFTAFLLSGAEATLSVPGELTPGAVIEATLTITDAPSMSTVVLLPPVAGLDLRDAGMNHIHRSNINGVKTTAEIRTVIIQAHAVGTYTIPALTVRLADGGELMTAPVQVHVTTGDAQLVGEAVFTARFIPEHVVIGQRVTLRYEMAFSEPTLQIQEPGISPPPQAHMVSDEPLREETVYAADGSAWRKLIKEWVITVDQSATLEVRGQQTYYPCRQQQTIFDTRWVVTGPARRGAVRPAKLVIIDVPTAGRPATWSGLIGDATVSATLDRAQISTGEGARLTVQLQGPQIERARPPELPPIDGIRAYPREIPASTQGRAFAWDLVPSRSGQYLIPPITLSTFDPETSTFRQLSSAPLSLAVLPGRARDLTIVGNVPTPSTDDTLGDESNASSTILPPPLRSQAWTPAPMHALIVFAALFIAGLGFGLIGRLPSRGRRGPHRGREFSRAVQASEWDRAAAFLQNLRGDLAPELTVVAERVLNALDFARFSHSPVQIDAEDLRRLERQP